MDPSTQVPVATLIAPFIGVASKYLVSYLKTAPWFNLLAKNDGKFRKHFFVLLIVSVLSLIVAFLTGSLDENVLSDALLLLINVAAGHGAAVTVHELTTPPPTTEHELVNEGP